MLEPHARRRPVDRALVLAWLLTLGQTFWWHNDEPHRSVFSFVMTILWLTAVTVVMTRPIQRAWREADEVDRRRRAEKIAARSAQPQPAPAGKSAGVPSTPTATTRARSTSSGGMIASPTTHARSR